MINAIEQARTILKAIVPTEINHFGDKASPYVVLRQVDQWFGRADNRSNMQYDQLQVDVWARDAPDFAMDQRVKDALEAAGYKLGSTAIDRDDQVVPVQHCIRHDYQYDQEIEEV